MSLFAHWRRLPMILGPGITALAILGAHAEGLTGHFGDYAVAPPTISRALLYPEVPGPFAIAMIVSAVFLSIAIMQSALIVARLIKLIDADQFWLWFTMVFVLACEAAAVAGMIVLSQFTGLDHGFMHNVGSYMLFFGHAIGLCVAGGLILRLIGHFESQGAIGGMAMTDPATMGILKKFPRRAALVGILSFSYGVVYFGGKFLPDDYFFWQRLVASVLEVWVILYFLRFLLGFMPLIRTPALQPTENYGVEKRLRASNNAMTASARE